MICDDMFISYGDDVFLNDMYLFKSGDSCHSFSTNLAQNNDEGGGCWSYRV